MRTCVFISRAVPTGQDMGLPGRGRYEHAAAGERLRADI